MVVTVRTLHLNPQEDPAGFGGNFGCLCPLCEDQCCGGILVNITRCSQQLGDDSIPAVVLVQLGRHPVFKFGLAGSGADFGGRHVDDITPVPSPVLSVFRRA